ncbi:MAG: DUF1837 domain-containing protein [Endomicrobia bacterium]|nr:DUF1837 domain-containing protein [Endomicrobiia bacterium]MCL2506951.1 DUF1837 domain-containing protein [Endomicrobiia bacterium]
MPPNFEVLIDDRFINVTTDNTLSPIDNKYVLSIINDFEDKKWRYSKFQRFIWDNISETALTLKERRSLVDMSKLSESAKKLRLLENDVNGASELAEILLYGIMKHYYGALSIVPKIFYKQNNNDYAKGSDSVHIVIESNDDFSLWFGEAKFYNSITNSRLDKIIESVGNSLLTKKLKKENSIITNIADLDRILGNKPTLLGKIKRILLTETSIDKLKPKLHIPILLLHECSITANAKESNKKYKDDIVAYHREKATAYYQKQINKLSRRITYYDKISFHIMLFPVPNKNIISKQFVSAAKKIREI